MAIIASKEDSWNLAKIAAALAICLFLFRLGGSVQKITDKIDQQDNTISNHSTMLTEHGREITQLREVQSTIKQRNR